MGEKRRAVPEIGLSEEWEDASDDADDVGGAALVEDPRKLERSVGDQLEHRGDLPVACCSSGMETGLAESADRHPNARGGGGVERWGAHH